VRTLSTLPIFIYDQFVTSISSVSDKCRQLVRENNAEVIFIDYLQLMGTFNRRNNRETEISIVMRELKNLAKELNIVLVVASQLSRQVENRPGGSKRPQLSDLRESGSIEQDSDKVLFIYRHEYYGIEFDENNESTRHVMELIMAKNNTGYCESIKLTVKKGFTGFADYKGPYSELTISQNRLNDLN
jgi:replicative DNA helicase